MRVIASGHVYDAAAGPPHGRVCCPHDHQPPPRWHRARRLPARQCPRFAGWPRLRVCQHGPGRYLGATPRRLWPRRVGRYSGRGQVPRDCGADSRCAHRHQPVGGSFAPGATVDPPTDPRAAADARVPHHLHRWWPHVGPPTGGAYRATRRGLALLLVRPGPARRPAGPTV